ncbi:MAG: hypothetical protein RBT53_10810 [Azonexus sp.]|nr:hypothetical protein [Azonexus sp.]
MTTLQLQNSVSIDIKTNDLTLLAELNRQGKPNIAQTNDGHGSARNIHDVVVSVRYRPAVSRSTNADCIYGRSTLYSPQQISALALSEGWILP